MNYVVDVFNLEKSYKNFKALSDLTFKVPKASCFGLLGPNGAGKSTTMKILYGKSKRNLNFNSKVEVFGFDPDKNELDIKILSGMVAQEDNLDEELNVYQNLLIFSKFYGLDKKEAEKRIIELLEFMELSDKKKVKIKELSGGMKRRLTIARALLNNPKLLFLDEPTTGLDPQVRHLIWDKLRQLKKEGTTILLTTHYMEEAFQICDEILIMDKGEKLIQGAPSSLLTENIETFVLEVQQKEQLNDLDKLREHKLIRVEESYQLLFLYSNSLDELKKVSEDLKTGEFYLRQSNLEDLFLKITGRSLNELQ